MQFAPYLLHLTTLPVASYVEVGCAAGGSFMFTTEFLRKTNKLKRAVCVDVAPVGESAVLSKSENTRSPYIGTLAQYLRSHFEYAAFFQGTVEQFVTSTASGPAGTVDLTEDTVDPSTYIFVTADFF